MKRFSILALLIPVTCFAAGLTPERSFLAAEGVAVFEPAGFDASRHLPSPVFDGDLENIGELPADWKIFPEFSQRFGRSIVTIDAGDADLYGGGEVSSDLRRNGDHQFFWNTDNPTCLLDNGKRMYQSHPWILGVRKDGSAFGIVADNSWKSELSLKGKIRFKSRGPAFRVVIIDRESPEAVLRSLAALSGTMELPPLWALGYQQCRYSYYPQERAAAIADEFRGRAIPCDVIWMDIHYMDAYKVFTFNPEGFSDPAGLNEYLHGRGFHTVYMIDPGVKAEPGYFVEDQGSAGDYFVRDRKGRVYSGKVWPGQCHFPDFTRPEVRKWWAGLYRDFMATGIDGVWNDMNEPSVFVDFGGTMPPSNRHQGGDGYAPDSHLRYHNIYGYFMIKATREGVVAANPDKRPFVLSRSNFLGGQRYAATWTGDNFSDWSQMKISVPMTLNMGLSLQAFSGPDIGGFMRDCTPELLRHWTASGVYLPFVRNHSSLGTADQEPWVFDGKTEDVCRTAIERRYRLLPYYYTLFEEASRTGLPVMRPVFWADFKDASLRGEQQAFLIGNDLLVVPRWSESPVLPKGDWEPFSFEDEDDGYQSYLALRPGAAVPVAGVIQNTNEYSVEELTVLVNTDSDGAAAGTLYADEGDGYGYRDGRFARFAINVSSSDGILKLQLSRTDGGMTGTVRRVRIGLVAGGRINYSEWFDGLSASMPVYEGPATPIDASELELIKLEDGSLSKKLTKTELIMTNIVSKD